MAPLSVFSFAPLFSKVPNTDPPITEDDGEDISDLFLTEMKTNVALGL